MSTATILELVRRCHHCAREMNSPSHEYAQNPYCGVCLDERLKLEAGPERPIWSAPDRNKMRVRLR